MLKLKAMAFGKNGQLNIAKKNKLFRIFPFLPKIRHLNLSTK